jgi:triacylglycerol lipase
MNYLEFIGVSAKKSYDPATSLSLALACKLAYENKKTLIEKTVAEWGFPNVSHVSVSKGKDIDTQCFVMSNDKHIIVVFRGSESLSDWFANFQTVYDPGPLKNTKVHEGFQDALFPAVISITNIIDTFQSLEKPKKIWFTGHSLGGAQCSLYAAMLIENGYDVYGIYTFGSPRPGNAEFADALNGVVPGPHWRVINDGDIVPHVPPEPFYSHSGRRIILEKNKRQTSRSAWRRVKRKVFDVLMNMTGRPWEIADNHVLDDPESGYLVRLKRDLKNNNK